MKEVNEQMKTGWEIIDIEIEQVVNPWVCINPEVSDFNPVLAINFFTLFH